MDIAEMLSSPHKRLVNDDVLHLIARMHVPFLLLRTRSRVYGPATHGANMNAMREWPIDPDEPLNGPLD